MKNFVANHYNQIHLGMTVDTFEKSTMPSKTVPGMSLSLKELLARYVRGEDVRVYEPVYAGEMELPDVSRMTEMDKIDMAEQLKGEIQDFQEGIKKRRSELKPEPEPKPEPAPVNVPDSPPSDTKQK